MNKNSLFRLLLITGIILLVILLMQPLEVYYFFADAPVLNPKGLIALKERNLLLFIQAIMLLFVVPIYILTFIFSWWYRADNDKARYDPHLVDHKLAEFVWWGVPFVMTVVVCVVAGYHTFELDPYKPIESDKKTIEIQVVALDWKWLFLYPEEGIASINYIAIPKDVPIRFLITAQAPMNSFWIPSLSGQIYAMSGMRTMLHLIANEEGKFRGSSAQVSGEGFAWMKFVTESTSEEGYKAWIEKARQSDQQLNFETYQKLVEPTIDNPVEYFQIAEDDLFMKIIMQYMQH